MIFCFPLPYFPLSQQVLYFLLSTLVLTLYIDVVLSLSILLKRLWSHFGMGVTWKCYACALGNNTQELVQIMAYCQTGDKPSFESMTV